MSVAKAELCALIPHADAMCLLHEVTQWDEKRIMCTATSHNDPANPLRHRGELPAHCAIEYAAQAMAVHGGLTAPKGAKPRIGFIASVRDVRLSVERLDGIAEALEIEAVREFADEDRALYELRVSAAGREVMCGRAAVFMKKDEQP